MQRKLHSKCCIKSARMTMYYSQKSTSHLGTISKILGIWTESVPARILMHLGASCVNRIVAGNLISGA